MMQKKQRLFIALGLPDSVRKKVTRACLKLKRAYPELYFEPEYKFHITLKFLGWTAVSPYAVAGKINDIAQNQKPLGLNIEETGGFISKNFTLYLKLKESKALSFLYGTINDRMSLLGFEKEKRTFTPHITLARGKGRPASYWRAMLEEISPWVLNQSTLQQMSWFFTKAT